MNEVSAAKMIGEWMREASVLVGVFGWLERAVHSEPFLGRWGWTVTLTSAALFTVGWYVERARHSALKASP